MYCGARDWKTNFSVTVHKIGEDIDRVTHFVLGVINGIIGTVVFIAMALGVLWALVALIHWMWNHS
jgi:hypothetical protein